VKQKTSDVLIREMTLDDLPVVLQIDRLSFPLPWPERSYRFELTRNPAAHLLVAEFDVVRPPFVIGFAGCWLIADEVHISTLAVHPDHRRQGIGERLLLAVLKWALGSGAEIATLEVRVSNHAAVKMYLKNSFVIEGRKMNYYRDNNEDALLMTLTDLHNTQVKVVGGDW